MDSIVTISGLYYITVDVDLIRSDTMTRIIAGLGDFILSLFPEDRTLEARLVVNKPMGSDDNIRLNVSLARCVTDRKIRKIQKRIDESLKMVDVEITTEWTLYFEYRGTYYVIERNEDTSVNWSIHRHLDVELGGGVLLSV